MLSVYLGLSPQEWGPDGQAQWAVGRGVGLVGSSWANCGAVHAQWKNSGPTSSASPLACVLGPSRSQGSVCVRSDPYVVKLSLFEMTVVVRVFQI